MDRLKLTPTKDYLHPTTLDFLAARTTVFSTVRCAMLDTLTKSIGSCDSYFSCSDLCRYSFLDTSWEGHRSDFPRVAPYGVHVSPPMASMCHLPMASMCYPLWRPCVTPNGVHVLASMCLLLWRQCVIPDVSAPLASMRYLLWRPCVTLYVVHVSPSMAPMRHALWRPCVTLYGVHV